MRRLRQPRRASPRRCGAGARVELAELAGAGGRARARRRRAQPRAGLRLRDPRADPRVDARGAAPSSRPAARLLQRRRPVSQRTSSATRSSASAPRAPRRSTRATSRRRSSTWSRANGGTLTARGPRRLRGRSRASRSARRYRGREVLTNPPPSAGGILLALSLAALDRPTPGPPPLPAQLVAVMEKAQDARTPSSTTASPSPASLQRFLGSRTSARRPTSPCSTRDGRACSVTCTNGEGSGLVVPGTGIHVNNIMGEEDLNPLGFHERAAGAADAVDDGPDRRAARRRGRARRSARPGSNRIRSAILQTIVGVVDHGLDARPRSRRRGVHFEPGVVYAEPGIPMDELRGPRDRRLPRPQPVLRRRAGGRPRSRDRRADRRGDPRRGGAVAPA